MVWISDPIRKPDQFVRFSNAPVFEWLTSGRTSNCPVFSLVSNGMDYLRSHSKTIFFTSPTIRKPEHSKSNLQKVRILNVWILKGRFFNPHCIANLFVVLRVVIHHAVVIAFWLIVVFFFFFFFFFFFGF